MCVEIKLCVNFASSQFWWQRNQTTNEEKDKKKIVSFSFNNQHNFSVIRKEIEHKLNAVLEIKIKNEKNKSNS